MSGGEASSTSYPPPSTSQSLTTASPATAQVQASSPPPSASGPPLHKRVYQACIPCRRRKVKCDLGSVDNPSSPPCVRCRRESKECFFSATRRKRKAPDGNDLDEYEAGDEYVVRNGRKHVHTEGRTSYSDAGFVERPLTPGGHVGRSQPLQRPEKDGSVRSQHSGDESNTQLENPEAQDVMRQEIYGLTDALDLLYKAATNGESHSQQTPMSTNHQVPSHQTTPINAASQPSRQPPPRIRRDTIDPALQSNQFIGTERFHDAGYRDAVKVWSRFRFVRAGWFTAAEAIEYIEYYYEYLSPLTPISPPTFRDPGTHRTLLLEEPILTITLLTIATRYKQISGPGGHCRSYAIHSQLWNHLRGMIERCMWGQEAFGNGMYGNGLDDGQSSSTAPTRGLRKGSLRTLGTIESLMILTEWHPRALHFPPNEATDELMLPSYEEPEAASDDEHTTRIAGGVGGKRIESWLEPAWRSDRMCWMLLANAWGLSHELGVFDQMDDTVEAPCDTIRPEYEDEGYRQRAQRIRKLLRIYITQLAGRLGWTNMVKDFTHETESRRRRQSNDGHTPATTTSVGQTFSYIPDLELDDQIIVCWAGITNAMHIGNQRLFRSRRHTTEIIQSGAYIELLKDFQPMLKQWMTAFEGYRLPPYIRHILTIEYEYVRIYVNSLSLQAVVERCTNNSQVNHDGSAQGGQQPLSPETQRYYGKLPLARLGGFGAADQLYVKEVIEGSRNLLRTVVEGLLPGGYLKHAPVRTYFRIISGAMFLLKTFALGASKSDVEVSISLMDRAVDALRNCVVDDVHLGIRFADLLATLTSRLRNRFMQAPTGSLGVKTTDVKPPRAPFETEKATLASGGPAGTGWEAATTAGELSTGPAPADVSASTTGRVSATPYDMNAASFQATPTANGNGNGVFPDGQDAQSWDGWGSGDLWYLPPGAAFFQNHDLPIMQTSEGVNIGGMDLLEYMAMDQFPPMQGGNGEMSGNY